MKYSFFLFCLLLMVISPSVRGQRKISNSTKVNTRVNEAVSVPVVKDEKTRSQNIEKSNNDYTGSFTKSWQNNDGTIIHHTFKIGSLLAVSRPIRPVKAEAKPRAAVRNLQTNENKATGWTCITKEQKVTLQDQSFLTIDYSAQAEKILPGTIYRFDNYMNGSWNDEKGDRNTIRLSTTVKNFRSSPFCQNTPSYTDVQNPERTVINNGINKLFNCFSTSQIANGAMTYQAHEIENVSDAAVKIGASGFGFGIYASNLLSFSSKHHYRHLLIDATKEMFTISTDIPAEGLFSDASRVKNDMMYISSVTYGVRVLAFVETNIIERTVADKAEAGLNWGLYGGQVNLDTYFKEFSKESTIRMYVVGGKSDEVFPVNSYQEMQERCAQIIRTVNYNNVQPIKYELKNMNNEIVKVTSATDYFQVQTCSYDGNKIINVQLSGLSTDIINTDAELYGQVWAQVIDKDGREILPAGNKDRLFDVGQQQHLKAEDLRRGNAGMMNYSNGLEVKFNLPVIRQPGARLIIYYWLMEYNTVGEDDFLYMRNSVKRKYNRNNTEYYSKELLIDKLSDNAAKPTNYTGEFTAQEEGVFKVSVAASKSNIPPVEIP